MLLRPRPTPALLTPPSPAAAPTARWARAPENDQVARFDGARAGDVSYGARV